MRVFKGVPEGPRSRPLVSKNGRFLGSWWREGLEDGLIRAPAGQIRMGKFCPGLLWRDPVRG